MLALPDPGSSGHALSARRVLHAGARAVHGHDVPDDLGCATDETYPFTLLTGRVSHHYHTGTMTRRSWALDREYPEAFLDMHPDDAAALRLKDNWKVRVTSRQGSIVARLRTATDLQPGTVFLPFHFAESPANALTSHEHLDPTVKIPR